MVLWRVLCVSVVHGRRGCFVPILGGGCRFKGGERIMERIVD